MPTSALTRPAIAAAPFSARTAMPLQHALALLATAAATAACTWLDGRMSLGGMVLVYLVAVAATAVLLSRMAALGASMMCVLALNFFFVPPRYTFEVREPESWWTLAALLAASLGLNALIAALRSRQARAEAGERRAWQMHALGETLATCDGPGAVADRAATWLAGELGLSCAVMMRPEGGGILACHTGNATARFDRQAGEWAIEHRRPLGRGCADWPDVSLWCAPFGPTGPTGAVQLLLGRDDPVEPETSVHWLALARLVGLRVERESAAVAARRATILAESEAARNTLLASLSHDLRTPLAVIVGSASTLRTQGDAIGPAERERLLMNLENEANDMTLMADNILQLARLSQPHLQLALQWESIEELLGAAVERMRRRWPQARIHWGVPARLPPVKADAGLMAQVLSNLVDNALRHGASLEGVSIRAGRSRDGIFIAVRDHGPGLPDNGADRLFNRFESGGSGTRGTTGLGLALCRTVVQAHGGRIEALRCSPGAEFRIDLPTEEPKAGRE